MSILKKHLRLFLIAINIQRFSNENEFCLWVKGMHLKDFQMLFLKCEAAELKMDETKSSKLEFVSFFLFSAFFWGRCRGG